MVTIGSQGAKFALQMGSTVVLARLLTPQDFGLIAMVIAITSFAMILKDMGLSMATVQKADINHSQISTLFWINVAVGILIAAVVVALAPVVAWFYGEPRLTPVTMALAGTFIFGGLTVQHQALLQRHMRFFRLGLAEMLAMSASVAAAIIAGVYGAGYWALVIMHITLAVVTAIGMWIALPWLPGPPRKATGVKPMLGFGGNIAAFNVMNCFSRNLDKILIGKFLGSAALGFYSNAYRLLMMPIRQIRDPIGSVAMSSLSRLQGNPERYKNYYLKMVQMLALITVPIICFLGVYSDEVILLVLGPQWGQAAEVFKILAFAALIQPIMGTVSSVLLSTGQGRRHFKKGIWTSAVYAISFAVGLPWGIIGVALSYTIANYVLLLPVLLYSFKGTSITVRAFFKSLYLPCTAALGMIVASRAIYHASNGLENWALLLVSLAVSCLAYFVMYLILPGGLILLRNLNHNVHLIFKPLHSAQSSE